jgi:uncharacterized membrane protein
MYFSSGIGLIHFIAAVFALIFGTWILVAEKGTASHRKIGYLYAFSMLVLIATAFMIYRLFGGFGVFHVLAIVSLITLVAGMIPAILRKPKNWFGLHFSFMYWSVFGLYAAFMAEISVRLPIKMMFTSPKTFFTAVTIATIATMVIGEIIFLKNKKKWQEMFSAQDNDKSAPQTEELA